MQKNISGQIWIVFAFDRTDNTPKTGDAGNITANIRIDGGAANPIDDTNPTELEDGYYAFDLSQAETNGECIVICPVSSTSDIQVIGVPGAVYTRPANFPDFSIADSTGRVDVASVAGTAQTANDNGADINEILTDTGTTIPGTISTLQGNVTDILADTNELQTDDTPTALAAIDGKIDTIDGNVDSILTDTADMQPRVVAIETDTNELQTDDIPGTLATIDGKIDTAQLDLDTITGADGATLATAQGNYAPAKAGDEMDLIDDAITSGKYDESTAFPVGSADTGATEIARTGADGDTLEDISDQIDAVPTASEIQTEMEENGASILDTLQDRLTAARAGYLDELDFDLQGAINALNDISVSDITSVEVDNDGTAISLAGAFKLILAVLTGKSAGGGTATLTFRNIADSKNRISATVDADGNRTAIGTRDAS